MLHICQNIFIIIHVDDMPLIGVERVLDLPELQDSLYSVAPTTALHSTLMEELVYDITLKFDT